MKANTYKDDSASEVSRLPLSLPLFAWDRALILIRLSSAGLNEAHA